MGQDRARPFQTLFGCYFADLGRPVAPPSRLSLRPSQYKVCRRLAARAKRPEICDRSVAAGELAPLGAPPEVQPIAIEDEEPSAMLVIVVALFRPDFVLDQFLPEFQSLDFKRFAASEVFVEPGRKVRFHVVRETDYGDRFKLFVLETPEDEVRTAEQ